MEVASAEQHFPERCAGCNALLPVAEGIAYTGFDTLDVAFGDPHRPGLDLIVIRHLYMQTAGPMGMDWKTGLPASTRSG
ncbi:MAG: hypothetical protein ACRER2_06910 [Methylococcales bacterium]